jgi:hypothetical protein
MEEDMLLDGIAWEKDPKGRIQKQNVPGWRNHALDCHAVLQHQPFHDLLQEAPHQLVDTEGKPYEACCIVFNALIFKP